MSEAAAYAFGTEAADRCARSYQRTKARSRAQPLGIEEIAIRRPDGTRIKNIVLGRLPCPQAADVLAEGVGDDGRAIPLAAQIDGECCLLFDLVGSVAALLDEAHVVPRRPLSTLLPFNYLVAPSAVRQAVHKAIVRLRKLTDPGAADVSWPFWPAMAVYLEIAALISPLCPGADDLGLGSLWITHDVDDAEAMPLALRLAALEHEMGISAAYFIPAELIAARGDTVDRIRALGHEIGLHGLRHDNRHLMIPPEKYLEELMIYDEFMRKYETRAYRAPSLVTSAPLRRALAGRFTVDSSIPNIDVHSEAAYQRGCGYWRPYPSQGLWEVPVTLPMDDRIFTIYGNRPDDVMEIWRRGALAVRERGGLVVLATHTQPGLYGKDRLEKLMPRALEMLRRICDS